MKLDKLLSEWDKAIVDLTREGFKKDNIRLRNCSLHFNHHCELYYINHMGVTYELYSIINYRPNSA